MPQGSYEILGHIKPGWPIGAHSAGFESRSYLAPGGKAQLAVHWSCKPAAVGSSPTVSTGEAP